MKKIVILGSTGSIGTNTLDVVRRRPSDFQIVGLAAGRNIDLLEKQAHEFKPRRVVVASAAQGKILRRRLKNRVPVEWGEEALNEVAALAEADMVVSAIPGRGGLLPTLSAIRKGKDIALAAKEVLVSAGPLALKLAKKSGSRILPVDSEHSAIFQCLRGESLHRVKRIILTASGGPFLNFGREILRKVTPAEALQHPRWKMGRKVSLDSATLMNKGLEVLEAHHLFALPLDCIKVVIHPQSIVHGLVEMSDGSVLAQLSQPDMRLPIQYALSFPERPDCPYGAINFYRLPALEFFEPDREKFPALDLAYAAGRAGGTLPAVLSAANEEAGQAFLKGRLPFPRIMLVVQRVMERHRSIPRPGIEDILEADRWARSEARSLIGEAKG